MLFTTYRSLDMCILKGAVQILEGHSIEINKIFQISGVHWTLR